MSYWQDKKAMAFALSVSLSVIITWLLCLRLNVESSSAAMVTIIMMLMSNSQGASLLKSLTRVVGTLLGCGYVLFIASSALVDPWLFNTLMIIWIVLCVGLASLYDTNYAYLFAMAGMTASVVGFPITVSPDLFHAFDVTQSRTIGILLGVGVTQVVCFIIPAGDDTERLDEIKTATMKLVEALIQSQSSGASHTALTKFLGLVAQNKQLPMESLIASSGNPVKQPIEKLSLVHCVSIAFSTLKLVSLLKHDGRTQTLDSLMSAIRDAAQPDADAGSIVDKLKVEGGNKAQIINSQLLIFIKDIIWLQLEYRQNSTLTPPRTIKLTSYIDVPNMLRNMIRALVVMLVISYMWIELQWTSGMNALLLVGIVCSMMATIPNANMGNIAILKAQPIAILFGYIVTFVNAPLGSPGLFFSMVFVFLLLVSYHFMASRTPFKLVCMLLLIFWANYIPLTNLPSMDFISYTNTAIANLTAVVGVLLAYRLIPIRTDNKAVLADIKRLFRKVEKGRLSSEYVSQQVYALYPMLIKDQTARTDFYKLLVLLEGMRLEELGAINNKAQAAIIRLGMSRSSSEKWQESIELLENELGQKIERETMTDIDAASAWWRLEIFLGKLKLKESG
ncbi:FUSC family protein [Vibrio mediterranei]|uniref:FUSC family protein n=1 Tax=Vibrio mediterranei TaxID=689 RepID=UPI0023D7CC84|nr:FUSC family protein [Vibrio mediterranei]